VSDLLSELHATWLRLHQDHVKARRKVLTELETLLAPPRLPRENAEGYLRLRIKLMMQKEQLELLEDTTREAHFEYLAQSDRELARHRALMERSNRRLAWAMLLVGAAAALGACGQWWTLLHPAKATSSEKSK
jgi:hypothetical protein